MFFFLGFRMSLSKKRQEYRLKHSQGIYEEKWQSCDLRKKLHALGSLGKPKLRNMDHFLKDLIKHQNHFVDLILGCFSPFQVLK